MRKIRLLFAPLLVITFLATLIFAGHASAAQCYIVIPSAAGDIKGVQSCDTFPGVANSIRQIGGDPSGASCYDATKTPPVEDVGCTNPVFSQSNPNPAPATDPTTTTPPPTTDQTTGNGTCGGSGDQVTTTINFGCSQTGNPAIDLMFAILRFMVAGVGVVVIASVIVGGIQYITAQGEPQKQAAARGRVVNALLALLFYLFIFAILQWLVPGGIFA